MTPPPQSQPELEACKRMVKIWREGANQIEQHCAAELESAIAEDEAALSRLPADKGELAECKRLVGVHDKAEAHFSAFAKGSNSNSIYKGWRDLQTAREAAGNACIAYVRNCPAASGQGFVSVPRDEWRKQVEWNAWLPAYIGLEQAGGLRTEFERDYSERFPTPPLAAAPGAGEQV